jgi:predicted ArsR family transcriptional regulator
VQVLTEPTRRRIYDEVRRHRGPLTRDAVAERVGVSRALAAFHLDALTDAGLLTADFARPVGRTGRGAGRPAKRYVAGDTDVDVSVPPRRYDLAARLLAEAVAADPADARAEAGRRARAEGERIGARHRGRLGRGVRATLSAAERALADLGYEPCREDGDIVLRNCPFHAVVDVAPELVCGMNHELVEGMLTGLDAPAPVRACLEPNPPDCCVTVTARGGQGAGSQPTLPTSNA